MNSHIQGAGIPHFLARLRDATNSLHRRLDQTLDIIPRLSEAASRRQMIERYAALHIPAEAAVGPRLREIAGLDWPTRMRTSSLAPHAGPGPLPAFAEPADPAEALGVVYVLEGSTLGGRLILRTLVNAGITDPALAFLDPYGPVTGQRWRELLSVLSEELADDASLDSACSGAVRTFRHAEAVLCGERLL